MLQGISIYVIAHLHCLVVQASFYSDGVVFSLYERGPRFDFCTSAMKSSKVLPNL